MKLKKLVSLGLCICMLTPLMLSLENTTSVNAANENVSVTENISITETELAEGEILGIDDLPEAVEVKDSDKYGHIKRLYDEEDDLQSLVFGNSDGSETKYLYEYPVKYEDEEGEIKDISMDIEASDKNDGSYVTQDNSIITTFGEDISKGICLDFENISVKMEPVGFKSKKAKLSDDGKKIEYSINNNISIEYSLTYTGVKEDIVVKKYTGQTEFEFYLYTGGLELFKNNEQYYLRDALGEIKVNIGDVIIFTADERNNAMGEMKYEIIEENSKYKVTICVDKDYLKDPKTVYPIKIDPTIEINYNSGSKAIEDVTINSLAGSDGSSGSLYVGKRSGFGISRTLLKFPGLNLSGKKSIDIRSANVQIRDLLCESTPVIVYCSAFTGNEWSESTANWSNVSPGNIGMSLSSRTISYAEGVKQSVAHRYSFDITSYVKAITENRFSQSKGVMFRTSATDEASGAFKTFASFNRSSYQPSVVVTYVVPNTKTWTNVNAQGGQFTGNDLCCAFTVASTGTYLIQTAQYAESSLIDTKVYLYSSTGTLISSGDNPVGENKANLNLCGGIETNLTVGNTYYLYIVKYNLVVEGTNLRRVSGEVTTGIDCHLAIYKKGELGNNAFKYNFMRDYIKVGAGGADINCYGYALDIKTNYWPWGINSGTLLQVDSVMDNLGYVRTKVYTANCVVVYGKLDKDQIDHFAKVTNGIVTSKNGGLEVFKHSNYDAYYWTSVCGEPKAFYVKKTGTNVKAVNSLLSGNTLKLDSIQMKMDTNVFENLNYDYKCMVYDIIKSLELKENVYAHFDSPEDNWDEYMRLSKLGPEAIPYILCYVKESTSNGNMEGFLVACANYMLGFDTMKGSFDENGEFCNEELAYTPKWYAKQLWKYVGLE